MPASPDTATPPAATTDETVLLPAEAFFVRRIAVDAGAEVAGQVEIALETVAPFSVEQLYYGYLRRDAEALVFATHRRLFPAESWDGAAAVLPAFLALLGEPPAGRKLRSWSDGTSAVVAAWDGGSALPAFVLARKVEPATEPAERAALQAEAQRRLGGGGDLEAEAFAGPVEIETLKNGGLALRIGAGGGGRTLTSRFDPDAVETMDVRDKAVLAERRQTRQRDLLLWRVLQFTLGILVVAGVLELAMLGGGVLLRQQREVIAQVAPEVERIQTAQALGTRIDEMSRRRLRPFEMLAVLNHVRPPGVVFTRSVTNGPGAIEIEAQTANADGVGQFESALRGYPAIETVEVRDLRLREGLTTFLLIATFRNGSLAEVAGTEVRR